ncbi:MAG: 4-hydroxybenzoate octaprenyltransferase [Thermodesulfobacteriota bacterium]|nr:MAG: 4-hydroxybenzoate octaprenyltransferase [Thermodesulfobacteriota bacterium]
MSTTALSAQKLTAVSELIRLPKQYGTLLVLWPTLWSLFIASGGRPSLKHLLIFIAGTFLMRSAGCAINDIADRKFDPLVERTSSRPLATGSLTVKEALFVFIALSSMAFVLVLFLNPLTIILSFVGIILASVYPFVKRVSHLPQTFLGIAFGWGAVMAWAAVKNTIGPVPILIFAANIFWSMAYDTIYALMDMDDDIKIGVKSTAILFGRRVYSALNILYLAFSITLGVAGFIMGLGPFYFLGVGLGLVSFLWIVHMVKKDPVRAVAFRGFVANAVVGGFILVFIIVDMNL